MRFVRVPFVIVLVLWGAGCSTLPPVQGPISGKAYQQDQFASAFYPVYPEAYYQELREAYVRDNPGLTKQAREALLGKKIFVGMPADQVRISWGPPGKIEGRIISRGSQAEIWKYPGNWVWMRNGKVETIQEVSGYY